MANSPVLATGDKVAYPGVNTLYSLRRLSFKIQLSSYRHTGDKGESSHSSYSFLTSVLDGVSGQCHAPAALYHGIHWTGGWAGLRAQESIREPYLNQFTASRRMSIRSTLTQAFILATWPAHRDPCNLTARTILQ
jgi:hypothetical protein